MNDDVVEELTKLLIKQDMKDKKNGKREEVIITKLELIRHSIRLVKYLEKGVKENG